VSQLCATKNNLKRAFQKHYELYNSLQPNHHQITRRLVLFYAVETGLKYHLLGIIRKSNTDELQMRYNNIGHNIKRMLQEAQCGGRFKLSEFQTERSQRVDSGKFHQMWRYGIKAQKPDDENKAENELKKIAEWLDTLVGR
jgi:hypothetical protein